MFAWNHFSSDIYNHNLIVFYIVRVFVIHLLLSIHTKSLAWQHSIRLNLKWQSDTPYSQTHPTVFFNFLCIISTLLSYVSKLPKPCHHRCRLCIKLLIANYYKPYLRVPHYFNIIDQILWIRHFQHSDSIQVYNTWLCMDYKSSLMIKNTKQYVKVQQILKLYVKNDQKSSYKVNIHKMK